MDQNVIGKQLPSITMTVDPGRLRFFDRCVQLFGGYGYMLEYPIARMFVDSRAQKSYAGANEMMRELIARCLWRRIEEQTCI